MNGLRRSLSSASRVTWLFGVTGFTNVTQHLMLAIFSLASAFGVWMVIQDVENPRVEDIVPLAANEAPISVEALNVPDGFIVVDLQPVRVRVNARKGDLAELRSGDFKATVDVQGVEAGVPASRPVRAESRRSGVSVLEVVPASLEIRLVQAATKELPVRVNVVGALPDGYAALDAPAVEPAFVTIRGRQELVSSVATIDIDINLSGARDATAVFEADLVARSPAGNPVAVTLSQTRARATYRIEQTFAQRSVALVPTLTGSPAPGYMVTNVAVDPPVVVITGVKAFVDSLKQLTVEKLDLGGATRNITQIKQIDRPPNVSVERPTVTVRVEIKPIDCGASTPGGPCGAATFLLAPALGPPPAGLVPEAASYTVTVRVSGPIAQLAVLKPSDFKAAVSLLGATAGAGAYPVVITPPPGIKVEGVDPLAVTLIPVAVP